MEIKIKRYSKLGNDVVVYSGHTVVEEVSVPDFELEELVLTLLDDTILYGVSRDRIVQKLIDVDIIDKDMVMEWALEQMQADPCPQHRTKHDNHLAGLVK